MALAQHVNSYYAHSANTHEDYPRLKGDHQCDICVVGGGFSGLSAALHLIKQGFSVTILEGAKIGWGASGRNGGQAIIGYNKGIGALEEKYGLDAAKDYLNLALEGCDVIREHIEEFDINCDFKPGHVGLATNSLQLNAMQHEKDVWARCGHDDLKMIKDPKSVVASDNYMGGFYDPNGGHLHPLNLALGEAAAFTKLGGTIFENSSMVKVDSTNNPVVYTELGKVNAKYVILTGNAYMGDQVPSLEAKRIPVSSFIITTEPLGEKRAREIMRQDVGVTDWRYVLDYYRLTADNRLLFGGKSYYGGKEPNGVERDLYKDMLKVFPQLKGVNVDYSWGGNFAITYSRMPDVGRLENSNVFYAQGYSGHGVTTTHIMGRLLAEAVCGTAERFDVFSRVKQIPFPGGKYVKVPAVVAGSWYYHLRDAIGGSKK